MLDASRCRDAHNEVRCGQYFAYKNRQALKLALVWDHKQEERQGCDALLDPFARLHVVGASLEFPSQVRGIHRAQVVLKPGPHAPPIALAFQGGVGPEVMPCAAVPVAVLAAGSALPPEDPP